MLFCADYLLDLNGTQAAIRAGYSPRTADQQASRLLRDPRVQLRISELKQTRVERLEMRVDAVVHRLAQIAFADATKLTGYRIGPCRYCWGIGHEYQWKTPREWQEVGESSKVDNEPADCKGGFGYALSGRVNPDCPECGGAGIGHVWFADTSMLDDATAVLFEGVKKSRHCKEFKLANRMRALELLADHLGMFDNVNKIARTDGLRVEQYLG